MAKLETAAQTATTKQLRPIHRRAGLRLPSTPAAFFPPTGGRRADLWWEAMISDLVSTAVTLVASRRFEVGTLLTAQLHNSAQDFSRTLPVRVARLQALANGGWLIDCTLLLTLGDDEMHELR